VVSYTYDPAVQNSNADVLDAIPVVVTDVLGNSTPGSLDITITDSKPVAQNDANAVTEDTALTASGNVLLGAGADTVGADANATPVTPASVALTYGSLVLNADGSYTYTLNNADPAVNALNNGQTLTDSYTYTLTDGDGSSTTADLTITINGHTDGVPTIDIPDTNNPGAGDGDKTVAETDGPIAGSFTIDGPGRSGQPERRRRELHPGATGRPGVPGGAPDQHRRRRTGASRATTRRRVWSATPTTRPCRTATPTSSTPSRWSSPTCWATAPRAAWTSPSPTVSR
jgi:VCBS repeat-containing protein